MGGESTQQVEQKSKTDPWKPAQAGLKSILGGIQPSINSAGVNATENDALNQMVAFGRAGNPYAPAIDSFATTALAGGGPDRTGILSDAYGRYQNQLQGTAAGDYLDPQRNPFFGQMTQTMGNDIQNRINGMFAGAGRDMSGANTGTLARGLTEGLAPIFAQQYNTERQNQLNAQSALFGAGGQTATGLAGMDQQRLSNQAMGVNAAGAALNAQNWGPQQMLAAEAARRGIPLDQLARAAGIVAPIAGLGGTSSSTTTTTEQKDPTQALVGAGIAGLRLAMGDPTAAVGLASSGMDAMGNPMAGAGGGGGGLFGNFFKGF